MTLRAARDAAHALLLATLADAAGCRDGAGCPGRKCLCRAQAKAVAGAFWLRARPDLGRRAIGTRPPRAGGWTDPDLDKLRALWAQVDPELSLEAMGAHLRRSRWSVKAKAAELGLRRRNWGPGKPRPGRA